MKSSMQLKNELFLKLYNDGKSDDEIAKVMQVTFNTIYNFKKRNNIITSRWGMQDNGVSFKQSLPENRWDDIKKFLCSVEQMRVNIQTQNFNRFMDKKDAIPNLIEEYRFYLSGQKRNNKAG